VSEIQVSDQIDIEGLRERLRKMTDAELLRFGKDNRYMCSPYANLGKPPLEAFVIQLRRSQSGMEKEISENLTSSDSAYTRQNSHGRKCVHESLSLFGQTAF
jgi:hypothetical protein